jgi:HSP20 family molecular chaperone IbpA
MLYDWFTTNSYWFDRPMLERVGYYETEKDGKLYILVNALGVSKDDISVDVQPTEIENKQVIHISGKTHDDIFIKDFSAKISFVVYKKLKNIDWDVTNGFLTLEIEFVEPVKPNVTITRK